MHKQMPTSAVCRGCRYALRTLETNVCPECGRAFDPRDLSSYIDDARHFRRRRVVKWTIAIVALGVLIYGLSPRGMRRGSITYVYNNGQTLTTTWTQLGPPRWLPIEFPGSHVSSGQPGDALTSVGVSMSMDTEEQINSLFNLPMSSPFRSMALNGIPVTPENQVQILKSVASQRAVVGDPMRAPQQNTNDKEDSNEPDD